MPGNIPPQSMIALPEESKLNNMQNASKLWAIRNTKIREKDLGQYWPLVKSPIQGHLSKQGGLASALKKPT